MDRRAFLERLLAFDTTDGNEAPAQRWLRDRLDELGFETYEWVADPASLSDHPSFPDEPDAAYADRPSVAGVLDLDGDGPTLVLNGHVDVVPANERAWSSPPFEPTWNGDRLTARGAADMKGGLAACVFAAFALEDSDVGGRVVVESVAGEEEGGVGAATAALDNPYPFERDGCIIAEPTELRPVVATEGSAMMRLALGGRSAHAATRWNGENVLDRFERVRRAFRELERERAEQITHPLYGEYPVPWPVVCGRVEAGDWASTVPADLTAEWRLGVAPGETVDEVADAFRERLMAVVAEETSRERTADATREPAVEFERFSVQFESSEIDPDEPVVRAVQAGMDAVGLEGTAPVGVTYGADARHYIGAGIPTVVFGPGSVDQAHFPDESVHWREIERATDALVAAARAYLSK